MKEMAQPSVAQRVRIAREKSGLSQKALAEKIGVRAQTIQSIESGRIRKSRYLAEIAAVLRVSLGWLRGEDECIADRRGDTRRVPFLEWEEVGDPVLALGVRRSDPAWMLSCPAEIVSGEARGHMSNNTFALAVQDESMAPLLVPGDRILVDPAALPCPGEVVLAFTGSGPVLRKYRQASKEIGELYPLNLDFPTIPLGPDGQSRIVGVVVEVRRALGSLRRHLGNL